MGDYGYEDDDEYDEHEDHQGDGPAGLRAAKKRLEKENRQLRKELEETKTAVAELTTKSRGSTLADILRSKSVNPKVSGLIPASVEATEEAVTAWLDEYKDILPVDKPTVDPAAQKREQAADDNLLHDSHRNDEGEDPEADELAAMREVFEQTQRAVAGATPGGQRQDVSSRLSEISDSTESFDAAIAALGKLPGFKVGGYQS
jgi:hypothetical protein